MTKNMTDSEKLLFLADWFDKMQNSGCWKYSENPNEVQNDLRRMSIILEEYKDIKERLMEIEKIINGKNDVKKQQK